MRRAAPAVLFVIALAIRLLYLWDIRASPLVDVLLIDSETYDRLARLILAGRFEGEEVYSMNLLYPFFVAAIYAAGSSLKAVLVVQAALDAASCVLVFTVGRRLLGYGTGLLAGFLVAVYGPMVFYSGALLTPTLITFLGMAGLAVMVRYREHLTVAMAAVAGLLSGIAVLARGNYVLLIPLGLVFFLVANPKRSRAMLHWGVFTGAILICAGGATLRNYLVDGEVVPVSANYAAFYIGHSPEATGLYVMPQFTSGAGFEDEVWGTRRAVSEKLGREVTLAEGSWFLFQEGLHHVRSEPGRELQLLGKKLRYALNRTEPPTNLNYYFARDYSSLLRMLPLHMGILMPLGLLGIVLSWARWREMIPLYVYLLVPLVTVLLFFVSAEYRLPAAPVLALFSAYTVTAVVRVLRRAQGIATTGLPGPRTLVSAALLSVPLLLVCNTRDSLLQAQSLKRVDYLNFGTLYKDRGDYETARRMLEASLKIDPRYAPAHERLAEVYLRSGNEMEAAKSAQQARRYQEAGKTESESQEEVSALADRVLEIGAVYRQGDYAAALVEFEELLARTAGSGNDGVARSIRNNIGLCYYKLGDLEQARQIFSEIVEEAPGYVKAHNNLGRVYLVQGKEAEAQRQFETALELDPGNQIARRALDQLKR